MIDVDLGPQFEAFVDSLVEQGRFASTNDVLREAVRLVQERETQFSALDTALERARLDEEAGRVVPADEVFERLKRKYRTIAEAAE